MILIDLALLIAGMNVKVGGVGVMYIVVSQWHNYQKNTKRFNKKLHI